MNRALLIVSVVTLAGSAASADLLYSNGPLVTHAGGMTGAVAGADRSAIGPGGTLFGFGAQQAVPNRMADDFVSDASWTLQSATFFTYQTGAAASTITGITLQIWGAAGPGVGAPVWGDATTNVMTSTALSNIYRTAATSTTDTTRRIQTISVNLPNLNLGAGTFWLDWAINGTLASGPWQPPVSDPSILVVGNSLQKLGAAAWAPALDGTTQQALPFLLNGVPSPSSMALLGLGGLIAARRRRS